MRTNKEQEFKELIKSNIDRCGYHVTIVGVRLNKGEQFDMEEIVSGPARKFEDLAKPSPHNHLMIK